MSDLRPCTIARATTIVAVFFLASTPASFAQAPDSLRVIQSVSPLSGPPGTLVSVYTENLPLQARVHVGVGSTGAGFEALSEGTQTEFGEVTASVRIPTSATWDKPLVVIIFNGNFSPTGLSQPFHVTDDDGMVQRRGLVTDEGGPCPTMRDGDGYLYALTDAPDDLRPGQSVLIEGVYSESGDCGEIGTIDVARVAHPG